MHTAYYFLIGKYKISYFLHWSPLQSSFSRLSRFSSISSLWWLQPLTRKPPVVLFARKPPVVLFDQRAITGRFYCHHQWQLFSKSYVAVSSYRNHFYKIKLHGWKNFSHILFSTTLIIVSHHMPQASFPPFTSILNTNSFRWKGSWIRRGFVNWNIYLVSTCANTES